MAVFALLGAVQMIILPPMIGGQNVWAIEQTDHVNKRVEDFMLDTYVVHSVGGCTYLCMINLRCMSFFFRFESNACALHSVVFPGTASWIPDDGLKYYQVFGEECPPNYGYVHNRAFASCYKLYSLPFDKPYHQAVLACAMNRAELIKVDSSEKQQHLEHHLSFAFDATVYIQGHDTDMAGVWRFNDNQNMTYLHFYNQNKATTGGSYILMKESLGYYWEDTDGEEAHAYFCEKTL